MLHDQLQTAFGSRVPAIRLVTFEEPEVLERVLEAAAAMRLDPWVWSTTMGIRRGMVLGPPIPDTTNAAAALHCMLTQATEPSLFVTLDIADHLDDKVACRAMKELIEGLQQSIAVGRYGIDVGRSSRLAMIDCKEQMPDSIAALTTLISIPMPDDEEIEAIVRSTVLRANREKPVNVDLTKRELLSIVQNLRGLTRRQIAMVIDESVSDDRAFNAADIPRIMASKRRFVKSAGVLDFVDAPTSMGDIGGLDVLKKWLDERRELFSADESVDAPKGVMLLGVQGAGKSLAAKAIATAWKRPLMRLDPGALFDRYIGESERRLREALRQAEAMSPVVLWIDEIEKGFASAASTSTDGGLSRRMFGTLLTWMQEHTQPVFVVATANDIEALPPELLRKRFDEIFFVDLPGEEARKIIFTIHLSKRKQTPASFDLATLASASEGFSGAEIEQATIAALTTCRAGKKALTTPALVEALRTSPPLSVTMAEKVTALREWAKGRCVDAG